MTREEVKENIIPILQAYVDGNTIQVKDLDGKWQDLENPSFNGSMEDYRVKPKSKYRPFTSRVECWKEMLKHEPFGWVTDGDSNYNISVIDNSVIIVGDYEEHTFARNYRIALEAFKFMDGSPFGIRV